MTTLPALPAYPEHLQARGGSADLLKRELMHVIEDAIVNHPRSLQKRIGPSEVGHPCPRRIAYTLLGAGPFNPFPDVPWLAAYLLVGAALVMSIPGWRLRLRSDADALLDVAVAGVLAVLVVAELWAGPMILDSSIPLLDRTVWATYPVLDALLVCLLVRMLLDGRTARRVVGPVVGPVPGSGVNGVETGAAGIGLPP